MTSINFELDGIKYSIDTATIKECEDGNASVQDMEICVKYLKYLNHQKNVLSKELLEQKALERAHAGRQRVMNQLAQQFPHLKRDIEGGRLTYEKLLEDFIEVFELLNARVQADTGMKLTGKGYESIVKSVERGAKRLGKKSL